MNIILGITGTIASGKEVIVQYFVSKGFSRFSLSDEVREEARRQGLALTRKNLQDIGDKLRRENGASILAERIMSKIVKLQKEGTAANVVIDSLRNPSEVKWLKGQGVKIIGITAPFEIRYQRAFKREKDKTIWNVEEFKKAEERDRGVDQDEFGNNVDACLAIADVVIENDGTIEDLQAELAAVLEKPSV